MGRSAGKERRKKKPEVRKRIMGFGGRSEKIFIVTSIRLYFVVLLTAHSSM
jgi:hypothetical protein